MIKIVFSIEAFDCLFQILKMLSLKRFQRFREKQTSQDSFQNFLMRVHLFRTAIFYYDSFSLHDISIIESLLEKMQI